MTNSFRRLLAPAERGFVGPYPTTVALEVTARGHLDLAALSDAFAALRAQHRGLDAAVLSTDDGYAFVERDGDSAGAALTVDRVDSLPAIGTTPLVDPTVALSRLHVVTAGQNHLVTLAVNHAFADGAFIIALLGQLWTHYTALVRRGATKQLPAQPFPGSASEILSTVTTGTDTGRERLDGIRWHGSAPTVAPGAAAGVCLPDVTSLRFDNEVTAGFTAAAAGIGTSALLYGVLLCAERAGFVDADPAESIRIGAMTLVDQRRRLKPPLAPASVTNFVGASFAAAELTAFTDPATVGAAIADQIRADVAAGRTLNALAHAAPPGQVDQPVVISNLGAIELDLPGDIVAEHVRPHISMDSAALHGPAGERRPSPSSTIFQVSTFSGRLGVEVITLGGTTSESARHAVAQAITTLVHAAARLVPAA